jgi:hypothetical protein
VHTISQCVARYLEKQGTLKRDEENRYLKLEDADEDSMQQLTGGKVGYRIPLVNLAAR